MMKKLIKHPLIRTAVWRLGRKLYCWARLESQLKPEENGEYWLLEKAITTGAESGLVIFDVGANIGNWTMYADALLEQADAAGHIYAFEPAASTFEYLSNKLKGNEKVSLLRKALSDNNGELKFYVVDTKLAGINSLCEIKGAAVEYVPTQRLDDFFTESQIDHARLVKCDTEGNDMNVLMGAEETLCQGKIDILQFEYNHRWIIGKHFLKDVFDFIEDKPYLIGKLYGEGIEVYERWHPELERFIETNYVLIRKNSGFESLCSYYHFNQANVPVRVKGG